MDQRVNYQDLLEVLKTLPPAQVAEVYDFARFLQTQSGVAVDRAAFLATFGVWEDDRSDEGIISDIYRSRAVNTSLTKME